MVCIVWQRKKLRGVVGVAGKEEVGWYSSNILGIFLFLVEADSEG